MTAPVQVKSNPTLDSFLPATEVGEFPSKTLIYEGGPSRLCYVHTGLVRVYRTLPKGGEVSIVICGPGSFFGEGCITGGVPKRESAQALRASGIMRWTVDEVKRALLDVAALNAFMRVVTARSNEYVQRLEESRYSIGDGQRTAHVLLRLDKNLGKETSDPFSGRREMPAITHEVLATDLGTSRELVTATMGRLSHAGAVSYDRRRIRVWPDKLREFVA